MSSAAAAAPAWGTPAADHLLADTARSVIAHLDTEARRLSALTTESNATATAKEAHDALHSLHVLFTACRASFTHIHQLQTALGAPRFHEAFGAAGRASIAASVKQTHAVLSRCDKTSPLGPGFLSELATLNPEHLRITEGTAPQLRKSRAQELVWVCARAAALSTEVEALLDELYKAGGFVHSPARDRTGCNDALFYCSDALPDTVVLWADMTEILCTTFLEHFCPKLRARLIRAAARVLREDSRRRASHRHAKRANAAAGAAAPGFDSARPMYLALDATSGRLDEDAVHQIVFVSHVVLCMTGFGGRPLTRKQIEAVPHRQELADVLVQVTDTIGLHTMQRLERRYREKHPERDELPVDQVQRAAARIEKDERNNRECVLLAHLARLVLEWFRADAVPPALAVHVAVLCEQVKSGQDTVLQAVLPTDRCRLQLVILLLAAQLHLHALTQATRIARCASSRALRRRGGRHHHRRWPRPRRTRSHWIRTDGRFSRRFVRWRRWLCAASASSTSWTLPNPRR